MRGLKKPEFAQSFDDLKQDYEATKDSRFVRRRNGLAPQGGTADYHFRNKSQYYTLIEKARDMDRNDAVIGQTVDRAVANIIQEGFQLSPTTGDKATDLELWNLWQEYINDADACDISGEMSWHDFEVIAMRAVMVDGDCVLLGTRKGALQFVEAHSVATKNEHVNTFLGVTMDSMRKRSKYWISADPIEPGRGKETAIPVNVRDQNGNRQLFHPYVRKRSSQTRGVTAFAPIFYVGGMVEDIRFAKLVQQQFSSFFTMIRERPLPTKAAPLPTIGANQNPSFGDSSTEISENGEVRSIEGMGPGIEYAAPHGETVKAFSPAVPNAEFFSHIWLELSMIGANLGMPVCQMLLDFTKETFVGFRGATDEARKGFRSNQLNLIKRLHVPVYQWKVRQWLENPRNAALAAKYKSGLNVFSHKWQPPSWPYLEPVNDAAGDLLRVRNGLTSRRRQMSERSMDWETVAEESVEDNAYAIEKAIERANKINASVPSGGEKISWRDLLNLPTPDGIQVSLQTNKPQPSASQPTAQPGGGNA